MASPLRCAFLAALVVSVLALAACGGPSGPDDGPGLGEGVPLSITVDGPGVVRTPDGDECRDSCTVRHPAGEPLELQAQADEGRAFVAWDGPCDAFPKTCRLTPQGGESVRAEFADHALRFELSGDGEGIFRIRGGDVDTSCAASCSVPLSQPLTLALTFDAQGNDHTTLGPWSGPCEDGSRPDYCLVEVRGETNVAKTWQGARPPIAEDDAYELDEDEALEVPADAGVLANDEDRAGGGLTAELVDGPDLGSLNLNANGSFRYEPGSGESGTDTFTYRARDAEDLLSEPATVTLTIRAVNDPPSFTLATDEVRRDFPVTGTVRIEDFARDIDPGGPDESGQQLAFDVSRESGNLAFDTPPRIDAEGTLTFDPNGVGKATFAVVLQDDEGATSEAATFTIVVRPHLLVRIDGAGRVSSSPEGIDCPDDCEDNFDAGEDVTLDAEADPGAQFTAWGGDCSGGSPSCTLTMDASKEVQASFGAAPPPEHELRVALAGDGNGAVSSSPSGIDCPDDCTQTFQEGTEVTLTAQAQQDSTFTGWSGACSGASDTCTVTMDGDRSATATFAAAPEEGSVQLVSQSGDGEGTITSEPPGIECPPTCEATFAVGTTVRLTADPDLGSTFDDWGPPCDHDDLVCEFEVTGDMQVAYTFGEGPLPVDLTVDLEGDGNGSVTSNPEGIDCPDAACEATFATWDPVTLTASADAGSTFAGWDGACSGTNPTCDVEMDDEDRLVIARFDPLP